MSCACPHPVRGNRFPDQCAKCARVIPDNPLPQQRVDEFFDRFREALEAAGKVKVPNPGEAPDPVFDWFRSRCIQRLQQGAVTYGNANFLRADIDLVNEALEEQMDTANYALMELVKHSPDETDAACLGSAVAHCFHVVDDLLRYKAKRRGMSG